MITGLSYCDRDENDERKAVEYLDLFMKAFCMDMDVKDDLVFRCKECPFETNGHMCLCKLFRTKFAPDYKEFGAMGDL